MSMLDSKRKYLFLLTVRGLSQSLFFILFVFLFIKTDYSGNDTIEYAVNILFRIDPLIAFCTMLAARTFIALLLPSLLVLLLSLVVGRSFCGWFCPMGSILDMLRGIISPLKKRNRTLFPHLSTSLLVFLLVGAFFGLPLVGYFDPFSLLVRSFVQLVFPVINYVSTSFFTFTYSSAPEYINVVTEPVYSFMQATILPYEQKLYELTLVSLFLILCVILAELIHRRFFCRNICPLGAMLGLVSRFGLMRINGGDDSCGKCTLCQDICRMGAINSDREISNQSCSLCMECMHRCPRQVIHPSISFSIKRSGNVSLSRRGFVASMSAGLLLPQFFKVRNSNRQLTPELVRPPGALIEKEFIQRCVRCGECLQVCITNALQPAFLQAGVEGVFSPYLLARTGYCEFNCTLCGQVCPTGAIEPLSIAEKHQTKIGHAWFDKDLCLPYAKGIPCIVCEEHCPTPEKAIKFRMVDVINQHGEQVRLKQPFIIDEFCVGCGICETKCPIPGKAAIYITNGGESRDPDNTLPDSEKRDSVYS